MATASSLTVFSAQSISGPILGPIEPGLSVGVTPPSSSPGRSRSAQPQKNPSGNVSLDATPNRPTNGNDVLTYGTADDTVNALGGNDILWGGGGNDKLNGGTGSDRIFGQAGRDTLIGYAGNDVLIGGGGQDTLYGGDNSDRLNGGSQNDVLYGGNGNDHLVGIGGNDRLYGGADKDNFVFVANSKGSLKLSILYSGKGVQRIRVAVGGGQKHIIEDFQVGLDRIIRAGTSIARGIAPSEVGNVLGDNYSYQVAYAPTL